MLLILTSSGGFAKLNITNEYYKWMLQMKLLANIKIRQYKI